MGLTLLGITHGARSGGLFSPDVPVSTYLLALDPDGVQRLRQLQRFVLTGQPDKFNFSVNAPLSRMPPQARIVIFWADLKLSQDEPFMPLIDGARMRFEQPPAGS